MGRNRLFWISMIVIHFSSCFKHTPEEPMLTDPVIEAVTFNYSQINKSIFIAADVSDPQGSEDVDSVVFSLYRVASLTSETGTLILTGKLTDDGPPEDIIQKDNVFSVLVDSAQFGNRNGFYKVDVKAFDIDGNESELISKTTTVEQNSAPSLYMLEAPKTFEKGDTLIFKIRVTDPQGPRDINYNGSVSYSVRRPDGEYSTDPTFFLSDSGTRGDDIIGDGIFTVHQPSDRNSKRQGLFYFYFTAKDIHGAVSDTLTCPVTNPGVTLISSNQADTLHTDQTLRIEWESAYISSVKLEYATDAHVTSPSWHTIASVAAATRHYDWTVPLIMPSSHCKIKISDTNPEYPNRVDYSDNEFTILP